jgi:hypothetical protein
LIKRIFKRLKSNSFPDVLVLILAIQRSGSTWLFDTLRCHPWISPLEQASIFEWLGLKARRYPRDMIIAGGQGQLIEIEPDIWELIPQFPLLDMAGNPEETVPAAIEKFHAHDFHFDVEQLCNRLDKMDKLGKRLLMVYQIRQPMAAANSFLNYQHRRNDWYPHVKGDELAQFICESFRVISEVAARYPGIIVDYGQMTKGMHKVVEQAFNALWPGHELAHRDLALRAELLTKREKRDNQLKDFLGSVAGPLEGFDERNRQFFKRNASWFEVAQDNYLKLTGTVG